MAAVRLWEPQRSSPRTPCRATVFSTGHLTSGVVLGLALGLEGAPLLALVAASVLTDWDYSLQLLTGTCHRYFLTHSPPVVAAVLIPLALWQPLVWWVLAGSMLHFALDMTDLGIRLNPFSQKVYGLRMLDVDPEGPFKDYIRAYFTDRRFAALEAAFALAAVALGAWRLSGA